MYQSTLSSRSVETRLSKWPSRAFLLQFIATRSPAGTNDFHRLMDRSRYPGHEHLRSDREHSFLPLDRSCSFPRLTSFPFREVRRIHRKETRRLRTEFRVFQVFFLTEEPRYVGLAQTPN